MTTEATTQTTTDAIMKTPRRGHGDKSLRFVLWITQALLAFVFCMAGWMKVTYAPEMLALYVPWAPDVPLALIRFIGAAEFLGGLGVVLPTLTRVKPRLTVLAAALLAVTMLFAAAFHLVRGENHAIVMPLMIGLLATFVAWGRSSKAPIAPR